MGATPLAGLTVLEFSHAVMGPTAGLIFAELGADVIKVEPAPQGDHTRKLTGFAAGFFPALSRSKKSVAINLKEADGQAVLHRLARDADVLIENYGPGTMERLGCGYEDLSNVNPQLIYVALKGYLKGPYEHRPALDEVVQFQSGLAYMTGPPGRPMRAGASVIDIMGAAFGVIAAQAALREREATGKGQRVSSGLFENAAFLMATHMAGFAATGKPLPPMTERQGAWSIYDVFQTAGDGALFIGVTSDQQWERFTAEFGLDDLAADGRLATNESRIPHRDWLVPKLQEMILPMAQSDVEARCERANVSWAPVSKPQDLFDDRHLLETGGLLDVMIQNIATGETSLHGMPALPFEFGVERARPQLKGHAPALGADTRDVLHAAGYTSEEITDLEGRGIVLTREDASV